MKKLTGVILAGLLAFSVASCVTKNKNDSNRTLNDGRNSAVDATNRMDRAMDREGM